MAFVFCSEVLKALVRTRDLYSRWRAAEEGREMARGGSSPLDERQWAATELRNALRSIEWDLEDLEDTVQIVEKNPAKFKMIQASEVTSRKRFIAQTRDEVQRMKAVADKGGAVVAAETDDVSKEMHSDICNGKSFQKFRPSFVREI